MKIEAIGAPFTYKWPHGEVRLEPGKPIDLPDDRAQRLLSKARGRVRVCQPAIFPGDLVSWTRGDGSTQEGIVDFLHVDQDGQAWAFVALGATWSAVSLKFLTVVTS